MAKLYVDLEKDKPRYVAQMFSAIATRYDLMNRLMTLGRDESWRRMVARELEIPPDGVVLDVAAGTGDIARRVALVYPGSRVVALDFCMEMMQAGRHKFGDGHGSGRDSALWDRVGFVCGDAMGLPYADNTFDGVTTGFALRNVLDIAQTLREMWRVLKPGGRMVCLEVSHPRQVVISRIYWWYFFKVVPVLGGIISGQRDAYTYLPESAQAFLTPEELAARMTNVGFDLVSFRRLMLGAVAIHIGTKKGDT
jgi:demethylmenaquinone methyltransferase/2-methoxy-6-polyprenyl-1,4-benzoquinol methylase